ncbi:MAG: 6-carboxytetrahydropterin synthase [Planctomycetaceae bacterium]|jgi:6-pyruvoyltetrahydropterin/6-carboxytetrahydropterin synthase|nr:6-carboxytetrahydropterin synthase [Planctomycetaceae bacterium]
MSMTIMRRIKFCAGHRLMNHGGPCEFFHGHNYVADFYVTGREADAVGRVIDFSQLKKSFKGWLDEHWDHGFLVHEDDQNAIHALRQVVPMKLYTLPYNPTAESMAKYLLEVVSPELCQEFIGYDVQVTKVVVWETDESFAEATLNSSVEDFLPASSNSI